jgi:hypothetical protein
VGGEGHGGVRGGLDRQDQVRVEEEVLVGMRKSMETDHSRVFGIRGPALNANGREIAAVHRENEFRPPVAQTPRATFVRRYV